MLGAKLAAGLLAGLVFGVVGEGLGFAIGYAILAGRGIDYALNADQTALLLLGTLAGVALWGAIGVGLGAIVRNQVGAIIGLLAWGFVVENLLFAFVPSVGRFAPVHAPDALIGLTTRPSPPRRSRRRHPPRLDDRIRARRHRARRTPRRQLTLPPSRPPRSPVRLVESSALPTRGPRESTYGERRRAASHAVTLPFKSVHSDGSCLDCTGRSVG